MDYSYILRQQCRLKEKWHYPLIKALRVSMEKQ